MNSLMSGDSWIRSNVQIQFGYPQSTPVASVKLKNFTGFDPNEATTLRFYDVWLEA